MDFKYTVSVIVPVYNIEAYLDRCIESLIAQTIDKKEMEVVLVDDGSTDSSPSICDKYAEKYDYIKVFHIPNGGVSNARNIGIDNSHGKYIMYLDSDDYLSKNAVKGLCNYFDSKYEQIDIMTYTEYQDVEGVTSPLKHFRYDYVNKTGVYDLNTPEYMYFVQTNMNIIVKNMGKDNVKFDTTMMFHEDQKYILTILNDKGKIGYYSPAIYYYFKNVNGATSTKLHPYYIHEKTIEMWESFIGEENAPKYFQTYFLNDFRWKLKFDLIWPYHYKGEKFQKEFDRIVGLLKRVDPCVISDYPTMPNAHKVYILHLCYGDRVTAKIDGKKYGIYFDDELLFEYEDIEIYLSRFHIENGTLNMVGAIKCIALNLTDDIQLSYTVITDGKKEENQVELKDSSLSYFQSQTKTNNFKSFILKIPVKAGTKIEFNAKLLGEKIPVFFSCPPSCPFSTRLHRNSFVTEGISISHKGNSFKFKRASLVNDIKNLIISVIYMPKIGFRNMLVRIISPYYKKKHKIWLYCDSSKTVKDNAYYQFIHDIKKNDGIERYYVCNKDAKIDGWFDEAAEKRLVIYGSFKHRLYTLASSKLLSSFYALLDFTSYNAGAFKFFSDLINFEVIYLQHGVLHAHLPTMYSLDRMMLDKEVVSTEFEAKNLVENYGFDEAHLIKSGMPRLGHIDTSSKAEKKILFAPSWRKFLVLSDKKGSWKPNEKNFLDSEFYKNTMAFLCDPKLNEALEKHGYILDFKPHPNFRMYDKFFEEKLNGKTVRLAPPTVDEYSYSIFVTDFSSFMFDFIYLKRPILYFIPDLELFEAGLNHYRELDIPFDEGFGEFSSTPEKAVDDIIELLENNCVPKQKYVERMNGLFFDVDDPAEALYNELMKN